MLEVYVQEVGALTIMPLLEDEVRQRICDLATAAPGLLALAASRWRQTVPSQRAHVA